MEKCRNCGIEATRFAEKYTGCCSDVCADAADVTFVAEKALAEAARLRAAIEAHRDDSHREHGTRPSDHSDQDAALWAVLGPDT